MLDFFCRKILNANDSHLHFFLTALSCAKVLNQSNRQPSPAPKCKSEVSNRSLCCAKVRNRSAKAKSARPQPTYPQVIHKSDGAPKRHLSPIMRTGPRCSDSKHLLSREDHKKPAFAGVFIFLERGQLLLCLLFQDLPIRIF